MLTKHSRSIIHCLCLVSVGFCSAKRKLTVTAALRGEITGLERCGESTAHEGSLAASADASGLVALINLMETCTVVKFGKE